MVEHWLSLNCKRKWTQNIGIYEWDGKDAKWRILHPQFIGKEKGYIKSFKEFCFFLINIKHNTLHKVQRYWHVKQNLFKDIQSVADKNTVIFVSLSFIGWDTPYKKLFCQI
jgi:hypothetical protein